MEDRSSINDSKSSHTGSIFSVQFNLLSPVQSSQSSSIFSLRRSRSAFGHRCRTIGVLIGNLIRHRRLHLPMHGLLLD